MAIIEQGGFDTGVYDSFTPKVTREYNVEITTLAFLLFIGILALYVVLNN